MQYSSRWRSDRGFGILRGLIGGFIIKDLALVALVQECVVKDMIGHDNMTEVVMFSTKDAGKREAMVQLMLLDGRGEWISGCPGWSGKVRFQLDDHCSKWQLWPV